MPSFQAYLQDVKSKIRECTADEARRLADNGGSAAIIDVRERDEWEQGFIPGARWIPRGFLELKIEEAVPDRNAPVVLYCAGGNRSALATHALHVLGYANVVSLAGGFGAWKRAGYDYEKPALLTKAQQARYSRHILLPEVGEAGQQKLLASKMLLIGAGGLGCPAGLYLAAAGVGTIGIIDDDVVDESNLQRQIMHSTERVGMAKVESARRTIAGLNPDVKVVPYQTRLSSDNVLEIIKGYDVIVDGADNFPTRYLLNDASVKLGKPVVHGSIDRFDGRVTVFDPKRGPCYRCLFPEPPPPGMAPNCSEAGVLGILPGVVGVIEATEAIKLVLGKGEPLIGRMLMFDAMKMKFREMKLRKDPSCVVCTLPPEQIQLIDYEQFCLGGAHARA
ncbi:MAG: molybdopterin-synthase adenylyltransferase MoeB [Myxococcota bacterium]